MVTIVVQIKMTPIGSYILMLSYQGVELFERIRSCGLIGAGILLGFEVFKNPRQAQLPLTHTEKSGLKLLLQHPDCTPLKFMEENIEDRTIHII